MGAEHALKLSSVPLNSENEVPGEARLTPDLVNLAAKVRRHIKRLDNAHWIQPEEALYYSSLCKAAHGLASQLLTDPAIYEEDSRSFVGAKSLEHQGEALIALLKAGLDFLSSVEPAVTETAVPSNHLTGDN